ncbi:GroES-like protein [Mycena floridula]|nr:GroES-like protein [Mycena floridula]
MTKQTALFVDSVGGHYGIHEKPIPSPGKDEVLVKIRAAALNPADWLLKVYTFPRIKIVYPLLVGSDIAGEIEEVGEAVEGWNKGDRIFCQGSYSDGEYAAFQQYALMPANLIAKIPERMSFSEAATLPVGIISALGGLWAPKHQHGLNLEPSWDLKPRYSGPAVVIGGSSSVGQYAIQVLRISGFSPIITYASARHGEHLKSLGATHIIDRNAIPIGGFADTVKKITDTPIKVAYDAISEPETLLAAYDTLTDGGQLAIVHPTDQIASKSNKTVEIVWVRGIVHPPSPYMPEFGLTIFEHIGHLVEVGAIVPNRVEELPNGLQGIMDGLEKLQKGVSGIKLVGHP